MKKVNPLWIDIPEDLLQELLREGVQEILGYKLCRHETAFDVDTGESNFRIRVCGGPGNIACQCDLLATKQEDQKDSELPIFNHDIHREEDF